MTAERWHGTSNGYSYHGCRCDDCRGAYSAARARMRVRRIAKGLPADDERHGTRNGYDNHGCRCRPCSDAMSAAKREYYARRRAALTAKAAS